LLSLKFIIKAFWPLLSSGRLPSGLESPTELSAKYDKTYYW
jgi:hypothetical protein